ncbi:MAG TPA: hypothetical protein VGM72_11000 [Micropepsaceae bacterium]
MAHRKDSGGVDMMAGDFLRDHRIDKPHIVDAAPLTRLVLQLAAAVPGAPHTIGIGDDKTIAVCQHLEFAAGAFSRRPSVATPAMEHEDKRCTGFEIARLIDEERTLASADRALIARECAGGLGGVRRGRNR